MKMKITVTGSLGHVGKPLAPMLVQKGHSVTVVSHNPERQKDIEALGAKATIGTMEDAGFLTAAFTGADAVYSMLAPSLSQDIMGNSSKLANNYLHAIQQAGVKRVVYLSSIGAHTDKGNGLLVFHHNAENILKHLPLDVAITFMRPVSFYDNLLGFIPVIKSQGFIASNYGEEDKGPWVSPIDIAAAVTEEITSPMVGRKVRYVASEELTCNEIARILGVAIGKPDLKWIVISDEQLQNSLIAAGMSPYAAAGMVEMYANARSGTLCEDYYCNRPTMGKVKMTEFAKEFAAAFNKK
jgi:uncharacterized protein YbjT (DUF2867 family)